MIGIAAMLRYYNLASQYPFLTTAGEYLYYGTIITSIFLFAALAHRKILLLGYPKNRVITFTLLVAILSFPLGYYGSRAAGMFYHPTNEWSFQLLLDSMLKGRTHTFHASLILPLSAILVYCRILKLKIFEILDTVFLYVPLAHALGRVSCFFIGCCWGKSVSITLWGFHFSFYNPVPLYSIIINLFIFFFLRRIYENVYQLPRNREHYNGAVFATYLVFYGACRIVLEVFRTERRVFFGLTNAQIVMLLFISVGTIIFSFIYRRVAGEGQRARLPCTGEDREDEELLRLFSMTGLLVILLLFSVTAIHLTRVMYVWQWPFQPVRNPAEAYGRIGYYMPMMLMPLFSLYWLKRFNVSFNERFHRGRFSWIFVLAFIVSAYYAFELLIMRDINLRGIAFWPPVLIMSVMNAFSEEIMYRLALYELLRRAGYSRLTSNVIQSLVYSVIHFMIAGAILGIFSLAYGFLLGIVRQRTGSIMPAVLCHFVIDLGAIGMPLLRF